MYNPQIGRWMAPDPWEEDVSPYIYVGNDPVNFFDPNGKGKFGNWLKEKANDIGDAAKQVGNWVSEKADDAGDAAKKFGNWVKNDALPELDPTYIRDPELDDGPGKAIFKMWRTMVTTPYWLIPEISKASAASGNGRKNQDEKLNSEYRVWYPPDDENYCDQNLLADAGPGVCKQISPIANGNGAWYKDLKTMVNDMWDVSEANDKEISGYVLKDNSGNTHFWVNDWNSNTCNTSSNPYDLELSGASYKGMKIIAQIHTHPSCNYQYSDQYDGPSWVDAVFAHKIKAPVYTIGPHNISVVFPSDQNNKNYFDNLGAYKVGKGSGIIGGNNPYSINTRSIWLDNPHIHEKFWY